jgi:hypothetical protein
MALASRKRAVVPYDVNGNKTRQTTADGDTQSWSYDYFGVPSAVRMGVIADFFDQIFCSRSSQCEESTCLELRF